MSLDLTRFDDRQIFWFDSIDSTMLEAARRAAAGWPSGTIVGADEQTAGQGRLGRKWHSEKDAGLYLSIVFRLRIAASFLPAVSLALGLGTGEAITAASGLVCDLRWPNDVLIHGKKCAGILVQLHEGAVISGIGINVNHAGFPADIASVATSMRLASGRVQSRERLLGCLLPAIERHIAILEGEGAEPILAMFTQASSYVRGRRVVVEQEGAPLRGVTDGLTESGFLKLRDDEGRRSVILAGGVRPV